MDASTPCLLIATSEFAGFHLPSEMMVLAVRGELCYPRPTVAVPTGVQVQPTPAARLAVEFLRVNRVVWLDMAARQLWSAVLLVAAVVLAAPVATRPLSGRGAMTGHVAPLPVDSRYP